VGRLERWSRHNADRRPQWPHSSKEFWTLTGASDKPQPGVSGRWVSNKPPASSLPWLPTRATRSGSQPKRHSSGLTRREAPCGCHPRRTAARFITKHPSVASLQRERDLIDHAHLRNLFG